MFRLFLVVSILYFCNALNAQFGDMPPNAEPGKCYAKCLIEVDSEAIEPYTEEVSYTLYVGDKKVRSRTIYHPVTVDANGKEKERIPIEVPKKLRKIPQEDLQKVKYETFHEGREANKETVFTEWREILCGSTVTSNLVHQVVEQLRSRGYSLTEESNVMSSKVKAALIAYQRDNDLPVGQLDFETLKALGVAF